jgi:hypothetical protein
MSGGRVGTKAAHVSSAPLLVSSLATCTHCDTCNDSEGLLGPPLAAGETRRWGGWRGLIIEQEPMAAPARHSRRCHSTELLEMTGERTESV